MRRLCLILLLALFPIAARAHIGSQNVFYEGNAGPYPVRVVIQPPGVVPGVAEISVRVLTNGVDRVQVLPFYWKTGKKGAPTSDQAKLVAGETNLFSASLWLMVQGAYNIEISAEGAKGVGTVSVPVNSIAISRNPMSRGFAILMACLGLSLFGAAVKLLSLAFGQAVAAPGQKFSAGRTWRARLFTVIGTAVCVLVVFGGNTWWNFEDAHYRRSRLYKAPAVTASVRTEGLQSILSMKVGEAPPDGWVPLIPDHGKLMHLFLIREKTLDALAHLHPVQKGRREYEVALPPLPAGSYQIYADVTHENGFSETLTTAVAVPQPSKQALAQWEFQKTKDPFCSPLGLLNNATNLYLPHDPDDAWHVGNAFSPAQAQAALSEAEIAYQLPDGYRLIWEKGGSVKVNEQASLRFKLVDSEGRAQPLEPYMGMFGHAAVRNEDGSVFVHLHPSGTISMAALSFFLNQDKAKIAGAQATEKEKDANAEHLMHDSASSNSVSEISIPYAFPKPGLYRLWLQVKSQGRLLTGEFDFEVIATHVRISP